MLRLRRSHRVLLPLMLLVVWEVAGKLVPPYLLATPSQITDVFVSEAPEFLRHTAVTGMEAVVGLLAAAAVAIILAMSFSYSEIIRSIFYPWVIILQSIPIIVIAPLIIIWFGHGWIGKSIVALLLAFFPIVINVTRGLKTASTEALDLFRIFGATKRQVLFKLQLPYSVPYFFASLRTASTLSVVGAVVSEFTGADSGLGFIILVSSYRLETNRMFAGVVAAAILSLLMFSVVLSIESLVSRWGFPRPSNEV
jgi:ABC-type nitrate/sulfonate/bicarbonate transport system permease component